MIGKREFSFFPYFCQLKLYSKDVESNLPRSRTAGYLTLSASITVNGMTLLLHSNGYARPSSMQEDPFPSDGAEKAHLPEPIL